MKKTDIIQCSPCGGNHVVRWHRDAYEAVEPRPSRFEPTGLYAAWAARADAWEAARG